MVCHVPRLAPRVGSASATPECRGTGANAATGLQRRTVWTPNYRGKMAPDPPTASLTGSDRVEVNVKVIIKDKAKVKVRDNGKVKIRVKDKVKDKGKATDSEVSSLTAGVT